MDVVKFGGATFGSAASIEALVGILRHSSDVRHSSDDRRETGGLVVISAFGGMTDGLIEAARRAEKREASAPAIEAMAEAHRAVARRFVDGPALVRALDDIETRFGELRELLHGIELLRDLTPRVLDLVMSFGERIAAPLVAAVLKAAGLPATYVDAREIILTDGGFGQARPLEPETRRRSLGLADATAAAGGFIVLPGFIGATAEGYTTPLARGGSDLTASLPASYLGAARLTIWSDVNGMSTADPALVPDAFTIPEITYNEALEMTHFGAKALNPAAFLPAMASGIPIRLRCWKDPAAAGTLVASRVAPSGFPVRGIASIPAVSLISIHGIGMPGVTGIAARMFGALARRRLNVILITQASSELSICCAVSPGDAEAGLAALRTEFAHERAAGNIDEPSVDAGLCVIAVVGEQMKLRAGISGRVFTALGRNGINVVATAQGSSELNISIVTREKDRAKALNVVHDAFFLAGIRTVNLFMVGAGLIGGTLLAQIDAQKERLLAERSIRINLVGLANSKKMLIDPNGIDPKAWKERLAAEGAPADFPRYLERVEALNLPSACFCDCTASEEPPEHYLSLLESSIAVVTPNKRANAGPIGRYQAIKQAARDRDVVYGYETTVGAGLPVIGTLRDLVACGDTITRIEAVLSGTVSFIFNGLGKGSSFSELVLEAKRRGYTEPDPRDDLGAVDIARKTLILIREAGLGIDYADIAIQPILPERLVKAPSVEEFLALLPEADSAIGAMAEAAATRGKVLRYVATIEPGSAALALREYGPESPFYNLDGTDNIVMFTTARYSTNPLVVRGPGAGAAVTAGGVFADILKTAQSYL
ncbi:bifunctional aspartate kinase/homoserine dehydrogenase I [bacterium]|nr:bifunctional aspartate kinase/homoserine dehydrogenase I [bacterium]